ncbi:MAG: CDC27 family protein [Sulfuricurvum sp.]|uniref:tetratricopeptide repeat protein n=1 Tax=Sulfuricurvum sp. TaxID=2025608 RepID=UPI0026351E68|nr:CDC27 family protein [Sulfuricurvum sp.]MDD2367793.1 CDC27 family protein [Sulfuricurvum sp.]MDD2950928.1 CDC27 family protein [Sulfuricurvum sp.]MDD5117972.1 CDC27 family protein [Sulfuricurvum sp.]
MLNIKNLERRWLKYKVLSYLPYVSAFIAFIALTIGLSIWLYKDKSEKETITKQTKSLTPIAVVKPATQPAPVENTTFIEPSMEFVQSFQNIPQHTETTVQPKPATIKPTQQNIPPVQIPKVLTVPEYSPPKITPAITKIAPTTQEVTIKEETKLDIDSLVRRFKETSNANLGLFIARYYYAQGNYNEAYNYALKTNNINNRIDESWIIFSKTLVKLGKVDQAKKTLQLYISQSNSENAKGLLDSIENGTFK